MHRVVAVVVASFASLAVAQVNIVNDVLVVQDPSGQITRKLAMDNMAIFPSKAEQFCMAAFNAARMGGVPDHFDGVFSFTASEAITDIDNVWQGPPVRQTARNIGRDTGFLTTSQYNSTKLAQCAFMGTLGRTGSFFPGLPPGPEPLPADPDSPWSPSLGIPIPGVQSLSGIEMLGHEYGHHWMLGIEFDQNDGRGRQHFIRAYNDNGGGEGGGMMGYANQHYSSLADSRSVMYGECIDDRGNGSFHLHGCDRKYSHIDQYLMGLRGSCEVTPMMVLEDPANPGRGVDSIAMGKNSSGRTVNGYTRHDITGDEVVRAMGMRNPAYPHASRCWRVAFIVVLPPGVTQMPPAMATKVQRYRQRWSQWFSGATDNRGTMLTHVAGPGCPVQQPIADPCNPDAGVRWPDGGVYEPVDAGPEIDAGVIGADAGSELDSGVLEPDAGNVEPDAGAEVDGGSDVPDAGPIDMPQRDGGQPVCLDCDLTKVRDGCSCSATEAMWLGAVGLFFTLIRRRR